LKENVPSEWKEKLDGWAFGCDVCQDVCPWNRFSIQHNEPRFFAEPERLNLSKNEWKEMTEETFHAVFGKTPLMRAGLQHIQSNVLD
jgi:epoxyqueuosine reductase